jgi:hypothetical protein
VTDLHQSDILRYCLGWQATPLSFTDEVIKRKGGTSLQCFWRSPTTLPKIERQTYLLRSGISDVDLFCYCDGINLLKRGRISMIKSELVQRVLAQNHIFTLVTYK